MPARSPPRADKTVGAAYKRVMRLALCLTLASFSALAACSSTPGASDGGADATTNDASNDAPADVASDASPSDAGSDATDAACPPPTTLHPPKADAGGTIFCPFSGVDGGKDSYCTAQSQHCCEPTAGAATCVGIQTACANNATDWQCQDPLADCPISFSCCATPGATLVISDAGCASFATGFKGTTCAATCTGLTMCTSDSECPQGKSCVPFETKGAQVGACQ